MRTDRIQHAHEKSGRPSASNTAPSHAMQAPGSIQPAGRVPVRRAQIPTRAPPNVATRRCRAYTATLASSSAPNDRPIRSVVTHAFTVQSVIHPLSPRGRRPKDSPAPIDDRAWMHGWRGSPSPPGSCPAGRHPWRATPTRSTSRFLAGASL